MQTSSDDGFLSPRGEELGEAVMKSENTQTETAAATLTAKEEERSSGEKADKDNGERRNQREKADAPPRKERSVVFVEAPPAERRSFRQESRRTLSLTGSSVIAAPPQTSGSFGFFRKLTTDLFSLPFGFFQSRPEVRTWGETSLVDPSVQPGGPCTPHYGWGSLPNYPTSSLLYFEQRGLRKQPPQFYSLAPKGGYTPLPGGPNLQFVPPAINIPPPLSMKPPAYKWTDLREFRMDTAPYVNARLTPKDPSGMYVGGNYVVGYPYGVPAVEENEGTTLMSSAPELCKCNFMWW